MVFLQHRSRSFTRCARLMWSFLSSACREGSSLREKCASTVEHPTCGERAGAVRAQTSLPLHTRESTHHCPGTSYLDSSQARHAANSNRRDPCNLRNCANRNKGGVVGLGQSYDTSPCSYQLVNILSHGTVSSSWSRGLRGRGARGLARASHMPATSHASVRAIDIPDLSANGKYVASCGCLSQLWECWGINIQAGHLGSVWALIRLASSSGW